MKERNWEFYFNIKDRILENLKPAVAGGIEGFQLDRCSKALTRPEGNGLVVHMGCLTFSESMKDAVLLFLADTKSQKLKHIHYVEVVDVRRKRSILLVKYSWLLNREETMIARMISNFILGLQNYVFTQDNIADISSRYGMFPTQFPSAFLGISVEKWERMTDTPSLGTDDILGSFMYHVSIGTIKLDGKTLFEKTKKL